jgi:hypothetical protein
MAIPQAAAGGNPIAEKAVETGQELLLEHIGKIAYDLPEGSSSGTARNKSASLVVSEGGIELTLEKGIEGPDPLGGAGVSQVTEVKISRNPRRREVIEEIDASRSYINGPHVGKPVATYNLKRSNGESTYTRDGMGLWVVTYCISRGIAISRK